MKTLWIAFVLLLAGCASVPMAPVDRDAEAKKFGTLPGKASLYIFRDETMGAAVPLTVSVNSKTLGQTAAMTYFRLDVSPGTYKISSLAEDVSTLSVDLSAGNRCFIWQEIKMGMFSARSKLQQVDEQRGRAGVMSSKMIAAAVADDAFFATDSSAQPAGNVAQMTAQKLRELQGLRDEGVITAEDFDVKKKQLLDSL